MTSHAPLRLLVGVSPGEVRAVLLRGDTPAAYRVDRPARPDGLGDLHRARVTAIAPAMSGAFVLLAGGQTGFLPETEVSGARMPIGRAVHEGMILPVRVTRAAQGGKGPRVTARLTESENALLATAAEGGPEGAPLLLARGPDPALRLARLHPDAAIVTDGPALAARLRGAVGADRVRLSPTPVFDALLEADLAALAEPEVALPGGGRLLIHPTPALVAIDVDAGAAAAGRDTVAHARVNAAAAIEAARQVGLRELAGPILIDFAGLAAKQRAALVPAVEAAFADDRRTEVLGLGPLGLVELRRRRDAAPLHEVLGWPLSPLSHGLAALRRAAREAAAGPGRSPARSIEIRAAPTVISAVMDLPHALGDYAAATGRPVLLRADPGLLPGEEAIAHAD